MKNAANNGLDKIIQDPGIPVELKPIREGCGVAELTRAAKLTPLILWR